MEVLDIKVQKTIRNNLAICKVDAFDNKIEGYCL